MIALGTDILEVKRIEEVVDRLGGLGWPGMALAGLLVAMVVRALLLGVTLITYSSDTADTKTNDS